MNKLQGFGALVVVTVVAIVGGTAWVARTPAAAGEGVTTTSVFRVEGMTCRGCEVGVGLAVERLDGVASADASYEEGTATVAYHPGKVSPEQIVAAIEKLGCAAELTGRAEHGDAAGGGK